MDPNSPTVNSEDWAWYDHYLRLEGVFAFDSGRAVGLLAAALLDKNLSEAIALSLADNKGVLDSLLKESGPLGTFRARIDMAFALGLLPEAMHRELHLVRKIRNEFAHHPDIVDFSAEHIKDRCAELLGPRRYDPNFAAQDARHSYLHAISFAIFTLRFALQPRERPAIPRAIDMADLFKEIML